MMRLKTKVKVTISQALIYESNSSKDIAKDVDLIVIPATALMIC